MARPPRIEFPGAFSHVIVRGNQRQDIYLDDQDRIEYLGRLRHYREECGFVLYDYVLMSNHVHLLLETPKTPLSRIMKRLNFTYTRHFNRNTRAGIQPMLKRDLTTSSKLSKLADREDEQKGEVNTEKTGFTFSSLTHSPFHSPFIQQLDTAWH